MVSTTFRRIVSPCWRPFGIGEDSSPGSDDTNGRLDGLLWYKDSGNHITGEFSMAVVQANNLLEDHSQLESGPISLHESGPEATFVGVYDGHGGPEAARFVNDRLFYNIKRYTSEQRGMSPDVITRGFVATEEEFLGLVQEQWKTKPQIASVGACCLVGIVCNGLLYVANAGDSRVVLGKVANPFKELKAVQLSTEHNASIESVREELRLLHPDDPNIVVLKHKVWRVKGIIQVSRSIGDAYLKRAEFNQEPLLPKFRVPERFEKPIMRAEPTITVHKIHPEDQFLIFASDGLWEHLSNQEAVDIVNSCPRNGVARKLVKAALQEAAKKREMRYSDLEKIERGIRRHFHDDITVIVVFLHATNFATRTPISVKGGAEKVKAVRYECGTESSGRRWCKSRRTEPILAVVESSRVPELDSSSEPVQVFDGSTRLYISYTCPFAQRAWIARNYKGLQNKIELVPIDLKNRPAWYKEKVYSANKVPALEHNNRVLGESLDLIKYIDTNFEGPSLTPDGLEKQVVADELLSYTDSFSKAVRSTLNGTDTNAADVAFDFIEQALSKFNEGPFFLGQFSLVDVAYAPFIERFRLILSDVMNVNITSGRPNLALWIQEMNKIEAYTETRQDPQELVERYKRRVQAEARL
ncbi:unnamed protein product [Arabidopsis thaliana]|uniref:(thale cress) hypothetical protein n=1 Tax=Arabidopsis thaliana TaxID=3702 RepID=A0A7G2ET13_ARATH|nr:unnamed protein product [Arabidopsis thaliana]